MTIKRICVTNHWQRLITGDFLLVFTFSAFAHQIGLIPEVIIEETVTEVDFPIVSKDCLVAPIRYDANEYKGVIRKRFCIA